ncbi:MAG: hypothetical protein GKC04_07475 [Methanomicrobiales archaeon]|nr:hypothetical protein [Methanomicrobiales archaeon]
MHNEALTGLGITIALAAVLMIAAVALALLHGGAPHPPRGIIPGAVDEATGTLVVSGPVLGFAATSRDNGDRRARRREGTRLPKRHDGGDRAAGQGAGAADMG